MKNPEVSDLFSLIDWYAKRAALAYKPASEIQAQLPNATIINTTDDDVQYFIETDHANKRQVVSVRGTCNLANAREDADYLECSNKKLGIWVHRGFDEDAWHIYQRIHDKLISDYQLIFTGHSLGAAIATLLMMYFHEDGFSIGPSYNFGQPKITNKKGVEKYNFLPLFRVVDEDDLVPMVPPLDLIDELHGGYEHFGQEIVLLEQSYYCFLKEKRAEQASLGEFWKSLGHESIEAHLMKNYLRNIKSKLLKAVVVSYQDRSKYY
ncbi:lipase (class 3) [Alteromonadaceae bacterium 2753L.S.0a.02]|nr:lipase (class 3) [Alteromonadaceae bacterium 2753L.S.0a.02]